MSLNSVVLFAVQAVLWHELWHECIEEASRYWFGLKNAEGMINTLLPLHNMMSAGASTMKEVAFQQTYGRDLLEAQDLTSKYMKSKNVQHMNRAWVSNCAIVSVIFSTNL